MDTKLRLRENIAAIDIGSNAIRMIIAERSSREMRVIKKFRFPIRLGSDVFEKGKISGKNLKLAARTFENFSNTCKDYKVKHIKAVGTSALREATNQKQFVELIFRKSKIAVEVIDGVEEAKLIHLAVKQELHLKQHNVLLLDIGGGSAEVTFSENSQMTATQSFPFGTVRTLEIIRKRNWNETHLQKVMDEFSEPLAHFLKAQSRTNQLEFAVGTGGNLESLGKLKPKLLNMDSQSLLTIEELSKLIEIIRSTPVKARSEKWDLRTDRADVILPAALLAQTVLKFANLKKILIPYVGLKDGLLWDLVKIRQ
jgi:exopolyphosphatase/guanosine-5'-triphosphate,3'-diphosphate pyrophosphatase